jgi:hypothetical protein
VACAIGSSLPVSMRLHSSAYAVGSSLPVIMRLHSSAYALGSSLPVLTGAPSPVSSVAWSSAGGCGVWMQRAFRCQYLYFLY